MKVLLPAVAARSMHTMPGPIRRDVVQAGGATQDPLLRSAYRVARAGWETTAQLLQPQRAIAPAISGRHFQVIVERARDG